MMTNLGGVGDNVVRRKDDPRGVGESIDEEKCTWMRRWEAPTSAG